MPNDASILIPTFNRPHYLKRLLDYYGSFGISNEILVLDSSTPEARKINNRTIQSSGSLRIRHLEYSGKISPNTKISDALGKAKSKYSVICADDDFTTPNSISLSVNFLEKNPDFIAAHGSYISFYLWKNWKGKQEFWWRPIYHHESSTSSSPEIRLIKHFSNYCPLFYAVSRTKFLKMIFEEQENYTTDTRFAELLMSMLILVYGKMKKLDTLSTARASQSMPMVKNKRYFLYLKDFKNEKTYEQKYGSFRKCLAKHLRKRASLSKEESNKIIENCINAYTKRFENMHNTPMHKVKNLFDSMSLPGFIDSRMRALYQMAFIPELTNRLPQKYHEDMAKIRDCALLHSKYTKD